MANQDAAFGLRPVKMLNGGKIPMHKYGKKGATTAIFQGDIVVLQAADGRVLRLATTTPDTASTIGVAANYCAATAAAGTEVWVYDDPDTIFEIQSDGTTDADHWDLVGANGTLVAGGGNTTTGLSKVELDYSATATGTADDNVVKVIGVSKQATNDSALAHANVEVLLLNHMYGSRRLTGVI